jgi:hypothetical protein
MREQGAGKKKKKQIGNNHTQEGIGHSLQGRLRANNRRGGGGEKARNAGARERNLSMGRRLRRESAMQTWNANLVIADLVRSTRSI